MEVWCESDPAVAVTVTVLVPVGVPDFEELLPLLALHATHTKQKVRAHSNPAGRIPRRVRLRTPAEANPSKQGSSIAYNSVLPPNGMARSWALGAVVLMIMVAPSEVLANEQLAPAGRLEQA